MKAENKATGKKEEIKALSKEDVEVILTQAGVKLEKAKGYDHVFVANMGKADYLKSSIPDDTHLALFVRTISTTLTVTTGCHLHVSMPTV